MSDGALRVWCVLWLRADYRGDRDTTIGVATLAKQLDIAESTVKRRLKELADVGAVIRKDRYQDNRQTSSLTTLRTVPEPGSLADQRRTHPRVAELIPQGGGADTPGGSGADTPGVAELTYNQKSKNQKPKKPKNQRSRDELVDALVMACGYNIDEVTPDAWRAAGVAAAQLRKLATTPTPADVHYRAQVYQVNMPGATLTPSALVRHWAAMAEPRRKLSNREADQLANLGGLRDRIVAQHQPAIGQSDDYR